MNSILLNDIEKINRGIGCPSTEEYTIAGVLVGSRTIAGQLRFLYDNLPKTKLFKTKVQDKLVVNLSSIELTTSEEKLLSKGLNFCPAPATVNNLQLETDVEAFARRLRLKEHFNRQQKKNLKEAGMNESDYESDEGDICIPKFKKKSKWNPPKSKNDNLESFITSVKAEVRSSISGKQVRNISKSESQAMINLKDRDEIVIKQADKGSAVVVMNKADYIEEGNPIIFDLLIFFFIKA
ncbi:unnamed protein product [Mytilus edulis]|uniref:Uncharacterized protein n=1 Tax=Mytilus edulis TaxID=6550 RepID=A0A8S3UC77_MYTED|nr:unnamed protein product [Mytilus edulis]